MWDNILKAPVLHPESSVYDTQLGKSQFFIQTKGGFIGFYHRVKLQDAKTQLPSHFYAVAHQLFADPMAAHIPPDRVAGVA